MTRPALLALVVLCRLALPVDATAQTNNTRSRTTTGQMAVGEGTQAVDKPNAHMTRNLRATRNAQRNLQGTPEARVRTGAQPRKATTRPAPRSVEPPR